MGIRDTDTEDLDYYNGRTRYNLWETPGESLSTSPYGKAGSEPELASNIEEVILELKPIQEGRSPDLLHLALGDIREILEEKNSVHATEIIGCLENYSESTVSNSVKDGSAKQIDAEIESESDLYSEYVIDSALQLYPS